MKKIDKKKKPETKATITKTKNRKTEVIKEEQPLEGADKFLKHQQPTVGLSIGLTKNMGDFESLRIDVWCNDYVHEDETHDEAYNRIATLVKERIETEMDDIIEE